MAAAAPMAERTTRKKVRDQDTVGETDLSRIAKILKCSLCYKQMGSRSKVLPCQHTFCKDCLEKWYAKKSYLQCPDCRTDFRGLTVECLSPNVLLERIMNELSKKEEKQKTVPTLWKWQGVENDQQPYAKALYDFQGTEDGDLSFTKGDIILLSDILDANWFEGVLDGKGGIFPSKFVKVLVPFPSFKAVSKQVPYARAVFNCKTENEKDLIDFNKGDIISVIKKVDDNWCEGFLGEQHGIFPFTHVELNAAAEILTSITDSSDEEDEANDISEKDQETNPASAKTQNEAVNKEPPKRHTIHVDQPKGQETTHSQEFIDHAIKTAQNRNRRASETALQDSAAPAAIRSSSSTNGISGRTNHQNSNERPVGNTSSNGAAAMENGSGVRENGAIARENRREATPRINLPESRASLFICIYDFKAQHPDELNLVLGEIYYIKERYRDGWCKGYRVRSTQRKLGLFPGNFLRPACNHRIQLSRSLSYQPNTSSQTNNTHHHSNVRSIQHSHSSSAPANIMQPVRSSHVQPIQTSNPQTSNRRTRSGSEPTDPAAVARSTGKSRVASFFRKLKIKRAMPNPVPPPYTTLASAEFRFQRPIPLLPSEPPPPYSLPATYPHPPRSPTGDVPSSRLQNFERCRAIVGFPPQSELELELKAGDIVYIIKKREDGWYHGKSQRTGKVGLFPASFVCPC